MSMNGLQILHHSSKFISWDIHIHTHTFALLLLLDHIVVILLFNKLLLAGRMWLIMAQVLEG